MLRLDDLAAACHQVKQKTGDQQTKDIGNISAAQPDFDTVWAHFRKISNEFNGLTWIFRQMPRYMDC